MEIRDINPFLQRLDSVQRIVQFRILRRVAALWQSDAFQSPAN
jgi:hypothetical protein